MPQRSVAEQLMQKGLEPNKKTLVSFGEKNVCWPIMTFYANEIWQKP